LQARNPSEVRADTNSVMCQHASLLEMVGIGEARLKMMLLHSPVDGLKWESLALRTVSACLPSSDDLAVDRPCVDELLWNLTFVGVLKYE